MAGGNPTTDRGSEPMSVSLEQMEADRPSEHPAGDAMYYAVFSHIAGKTTCSVGERLQEFVQEVRHADDLGFDYYFTTEHHFSKNFSLSPSQPISLTVIAQNSKRLRFGPMIIIIPCSQPIRVAEEMVILDHMSGGRLEIGLGRGIRAHEHIAYGIRTQEDQGRLDESIEFLTKAWTSEEKFSWMGQYYTYIDVEMPWLPLQKPYPRLWMPTGTPGHAEHAGKEGWGTGGFSYLGMDLYRPVFDAYRKGWEESGRPAEDMRVGWLAPTIVADSDEEARRLMDEHFPKQVGLFEYEASRTYSLVDSAGRARVEKSFERFDAMKADMDGSDEKIMFLCGSPDTVTEKIQHLRTEMGVNVIMGEFSFGDLDYEDVARSMELMATKVWPNFQRSPNGSPAA
jgi:alkanesulfonate monooxygenase SsuD/methylene tetrahydromethanopterin reductase-like flavin-dependent oxidoreductase (luciferase family)